MLKPENNNFYDVLFNNNKLIKTRTVPEKNISEELLTIRTLVLIIAPTNEMEEYVQLEKMLTACKLTKEDYKVELQAEDWNYYRTFENIKEVLLFGISEKELNISVQLIGNHINKFDNRVFIKSLSIAQLANSQQDKNSLWQNALKPHFVG
ncbi:MAG: hypothetical protein WC756_11780 [Taibaiella sp.]|jgi:hypothetical protein